MSHRNLLYHLILVLLFCSCGSSHYHHLTVKSKPHHERRTLKHQAPNKLEFPNIKLNSMLLVYEPADNKMPLNPKALQFIDVEPVANELLIANKVISTPVGHEQQQMEPVAKNGNFAELLGAFILISLLSLGMGGIAALFGMYFWKAVLISFIVSVLVFMFAEE